MLKFVRRRNTLTSTNELSNLFKPIRKVYSENDLPLTGYLNFTKEVALKNGIYTIQSKSSEIFVTYRHESSKRVSCCIDDLPKVCTVQQINNNNTYLDIKTLSNNLKNDNLVYFITGKTFQINKTKYPVGSLFKIVEEKNTRRSFKLKNRKSGLYVSDCRDEQKFHIPFSTQGEFKRCEEPVKIQRQDELKTFNTPYLAVIENTKRIHLYIEEQKEKEIALASIKHCNVFMNVKFSFDDATIRLLDYEKQISYL